MNVLDYGAMADMLTLSSAVTMTVGSGVANIPGASFTSTDVGKPITILGAGASGAPIAGTITAWTSATSITVSVDASTALTGAADVTVIYGTDNTPYFIDAISALPASGGTIYVPAGRYYFAPNTQVIEPPPNSIFYGDGKNASILYFDWICHNYQRALFDNDQLTSGSVEFAYLGFIGAIYLGLGSGPRMIDLESQAGYITDVRLHNCGFTNLGGGAIFCSLINNVQIIENDVNYSFSGAFDTWDCNSVDISHNYIKGTGDDCIAAHTVDTVGASPNPLIPLRGGVRFCNNTIEDSQGLSIEGSKQCVIVGNTFRRCLNYAMNLSFGNTAFAQGNTQAFSLIVRNNYIADVWYPQAIPRQENHFAIFVGVPTKSPGSGSSSVGSAPGTPYTSGSSTTIVPLYGSDNSFGGFYLNDVASSGNSGASYTTPCAGAYWIDISDNQIVRTLPATAEWSQWGYGTQVLSKDTSATPVSYQAYNPVITDLNLQNPGIVLYGSIKNSRIANNIIQTGGPPISLGSKANNLDYENVVIEGNILADFAAVPQAQNYPAPGTGAVANIAAGIAWLGASATTQRIVIRNNFFDGDPNFSSSFRGANGTWTTSTGTPSGISAQYLQGVVFENNHFRNVVTPIQGNSLQTVKGNVAYGVPAAVGYSASNNGIGVVPTPGYGWTHVIEQGDLTQSTYGEIVFAPYSESSAIPSTGTWVEGVFVRNASPVVASGQILLGWSRLTTGSGNTSGTDWTPVYGSTT